MRSGQYILECNTAESLEYLRIANPDLSNIVFERIAVTADYALIFAVLLRTGGFKPHEDFHFRKVGLIL